MTREEAIRILNQLVVPSSDVHPDDYNMVYEALDMAVSALNAINHQKEDK